MAVQTRDDDPDGDLYPTDVVLRDRLDVEARRYRPSMSATDRDEAVQIAQVRMVGRLGSDSPIPCWTYAARTLHHVLHDMHRAAVRRHRQWLADAAVQEGAVARDVADVASVRLDVRRALRGLPPRQRNAVVLVDMYGYPADDAAAILGEPVVALRSALQRGRRALKVALAGTMGGLLGIATRLRRLLTPASAAPVAVLAAAAAVLYVVTAPIVSPLPHVSTLGIVQPDEPRRAVPDPKVPRPHLEPLTDTSDDAGGDTATPESKRLPAPPIENAPANVCLRENDYCTSRVAHGDQVCTHVQDVGGPCAKSNLPILCDPLRRVAPEEVTCTRDKGVDSP